MKTLRVTRRTIIRNFLPESTQWFFTCSLCNVRQSSRKLFSIHPDPKPRPINHTAESWPYAMRYVCHGCRLDDYKAVDFTEVVK